jgi:diacylglycerol kinase family enzyme
MTEVSEHVYALSVFGWGLAGAVALKADKLRWLPGQRSARYDIAGFVTMIQDWPVIDNGMLEYWEGDRDAAGEKVWKSTEVSCINLVATNLSKLGNDHPIWPTIEPDDGTLAFSYIDGKNGRLDVARLAMAMKRGKYLGQQPGVVSYIVKEFRLTPIAGKCKSPFLIDGDPHDHSPIHVEVLHRALTVFVLPEAPVAPATGVAAGIAAAVAPATGINLGALMQQHKAANAHGLAAGLGAMFGAA